MGQKDTFTETLLVDTGYQKCEKRVLGMNEDVTRDFGILRWAFDAELKDLAV